MNRSRGTCPRCSHPTVPVKRMVFHEITPAAIARAVDEWRDLDRRLVDAQEARRILDRLYGYEVSPVLWRKVMPRLVGRPRAERRHPHGGRARAGPDAIPLGDVVGRRGHVRQRGGAATASGPPWSRSVGRPSPPARTSTSRASRPPRRRCGSWAKTRRPRSPSALTGETFTVKSVTERPFRRSPAAPFMTSTLQQEAGRKLRFSAQRAMQVAQRLYEQGYITYMRTDSTTLSDEALTAARGPGPRDVTATTTCRTRRDATSARSRTRRRRTRRSAHRARASARPSRSAASCRVTSSASTR